MAFPFPAAPHYLITERTPQWVAQGIPLAVIEQVNARVDDLWRDGPGCWPFEWSAAAAEAEARGDFLERCAEGLSFHAGTASTLPLPGFCDR